MGRPVRTGLRHCLLNDCKYGYSVKDNRIELSLLKSSKNPDETADMGIHEFTYSLLPHQAALADSEVFAQAEDLNQPLYPMKGRPGAACVRMFCWEADNVIVDAVKPAEDGNGSSCGFMNAAGKGYLSSCSRNGGWRIIRNVICWKSL